MVGEGLAYPRMCSLTFTMSEPPYRIPQIVIRRLRYLLVVLFLPYAHVRENASTSTIFSYFQNLQFSLNN